MYSQRLKKAVFPSSFRHGYGNKNAVGEWENVDESIEEGFLTMSDGGLLKVNAILIENEKNKELLVYIRSTADYCRLLEKMKQTVDRMKTVIKYSNPYLSVLRGRLRLLCGNVLNDARFFGTPLGE